MHALVDERVMAVNVPGILPSILCGCSVVVLKSLHRHLHRGKLKGRTFFSFQSFWAYTPIKNTHIYNHKCPIELGLAAYLFNDDRRNMKINRANLIMPLQVTKAVMSSAEVTSKAGFQT